MKREHSPKDRIDDPREQPICSVLNLDTFRRVPVVPDREDTGRSATQRQPDPVAQNAHTGLPSERLAASMKSHGTKMLVALTDIVRTDERIHPPTCTGAGQSAYNGVSDYRNGTARR
jgi:hypothetical protein